MKEIRAKRLEEYKIEKLIKLEDRIVNVTADYKRQIKRLEKEKKQIEEIEVIPSQDERDSAYEIGSSITFSN